MARRRRTHRRKSALGALGSPLGGGLLLWGGLALAAWWALGGKKDTKKPDGALVKGDEVLDAPAAKKPETVTKKAVEANTPKAPDNVVPLTPPEQAKADAAEAKRKFDLIEQQFSRTPPKSLIALDFDSLQNAERTACDYGREDCELIGHFIDRCFSVTNGLAKTADDAPRYCFTDIGWRLHIDRQRKSRAQQEADDRAAETEYYRMMREQQDAGYEQEADGADEGAY